MKLSPRTISILQNFQTISTAILFRPGKRIRTISPSDTIFAEAEVEDEFPREFAIYELSRFLGILSLDKNSELEFHDKYMIIKQQHGSTRYFYCHPEMVSNEQNLVKLRGDRPMADPVESAIVTFEMSSQVLGSLIKSMGILGFKEVAVCGSEGVLSLDALDVLAEKRGRDYPNRFSATIGQTSKTFMATIEAEKLKMIPMDYTVMVSKKLGALYLKGKFEDAVPLKYFIVLSGDKSDFKHV